MTINDQVARNNLVKLKTQRPFQKNQPQVQPNRLLKNRPNFKELGRKGSPFQPASVKRHLTYSLNMKPSRPEPEQFEFRQTLKPQD